MKNTTVNIVSSQKVISTFDIDNQSMSVQAVPNVGFVILNKDTKLSPKQLRTAKKGNDLVIKTTDDDETYLVIKDYFITDDVQIIGVSNDQFAPYIISPVESTATATLGAVIAETNYTPYLLGLLGVGGVALASGGSDDKGGTSLSTSQITPNPVHPPSNTPIEILLSNLNVDEHATGAVIGTLSVDNTDSYTYMVNDDRFEILNNQLKLKNGIVLDHEAERSVTIEISAINQNGLSHKQSFSILINDINEAPTDITLSINSILENERSLGSVYISDDKFTDYAYQINDPRFEIIDGYLRVKDDHVIDYETEKQLDISIKVIDEDLSFSKEFTIDVKDVLEKTTLTGDDQNNTLGFIDSNDQYYIFGGTGDDILTGGTNNDILRGGAGTDIMDGGAGDDKFIIVGDLTLGGKLDSDEDAELLGVALSSLNGQNLNEDNNGAVEIIRGGDGEDTLYVYGNADLSNYDLSGIEHVVLRSDVKFTATQLQGFKTVKGDGLSTLRIDNKTESEQTVDLSELQLTGIGHIGLNNTKLSFTELGQLGGVNSVSGKGVLITTNPNIDLKGISLDTSIDAMCIDDSGQSKPITGATYVESTELISSIQDGFRLVEGDERNNKLNGYRTDDRIIGGLGNDEIRAEDGNDEIWGDEGALEIDPLDDATENNTTSPNDSNLPNQTSSLRLVNNLGGEKGFGESFLDRNDDGSTGKIDITSVFGEEGLNFFGTKYTSLYINNNGNITFNGPSGQYTPNQIDGGVNNPIIAAFWADVDTRGGETTVSQGGNSTGSNLVWYDLNAENKTLTVTWDDVGYYSSRTDKTNAFQIQLVGKENGNFDIVYHYEDIQWTTGKASGGSSGLGGTVARAGYSSGDGVHYHELAESGDQEKMLTLKGTQTFAVSNSHVLEKATHDTIDAGEGDDVIVGGRGNDKIDGGEGQDIAKYLLNKADYKVEQQGGQTIVTALRGNEGTDTLVNIEKLVFADGEIEIKPLKTSEQIFNDLENGGYYSTLWRMVDAVQYNSETANMSIVKQSEIDMQEAGLQFLRGDVLGLDAQKFEGNIYHSELGQATVAIVQDALFISFAKDEGKSASSDELYQSFAPIISAVDKYLQKYSHSIKTVYVAGHDMGGGTVERYMNEHSDGQFGVNYKGVTYSANPYNDFYNPNSIGGFDKRLVQFEWDNSWAADAGVNKGHVVNMHNIGKNGWFDSEFLSNANGFWQTVSGKYSSLEYFKDITSYFDNELLEKGLAFGKKKGLLGDFLESFIGDDRVFIPFDFQTKKVSTEDSELDLPTVGLAFLEILKAVKEGFIPKSDFTQKYDLTLLSDEEVLNEATKASESISALLSLKDAAVSIADIGAQFVTNQVLFGGHGKDEYNGGAFDDVLFGSNGDDSLAGGMGNDVIYAGAGDDIIDSPRKFHNFPQFFTNLIIGTDYEKILEEIKKLGEADFSTLISNIVDSTASHSIDTIFDIGFKYSDSLERLYKAGKLDYKVFSLFKQDQALKDDVKGVLKEALGFDAQTGQSKHLVGIVKNLISMVLDNIIDTVGETFVWRSEGNDVLHGGAGNDTYFIDNPRDRIVDSEGELDALIVTGSRFNWFANNNYLLPEAVEIGILKDDLISKSENFNLSASLLSGTRYLIGNAGNNQIIGGYGDDYIIGGADQDALFGSRGNDVLVGTKLANIEEYGYSINIPENIRELIQEHASGFAVDDEDASLMYGGTGNDSMYGANDNDYFLIDVNRGIGGVGYSNTNNIDKIYNFHIDNPSLALDEDYLVFSAEQLGINYDFVSANTDNSVITNGLNGLDDFSETIAGVNISGYHWFDEYDDKRGLDQLLEFADDDYKALYKVSNLDEYHAYAHDEDVLPAPVFVLNTQTGSLYFDQNGPRQGGNDLVEVAKLQTTENNRDLASFHANQIVILPNFDHLTPII